MTTRASLQQATFKHIIDNVLDDADHVEECLLSVQTTKAGSIIALTKNIIKTAKY
jgi:hypothetical protein